MSLLKQIVRPTLLLDEARCRTNIERMTRKAQKHGLMFRPHFKTHQSHVIASWFREQGVTQITVSSLQMADYFAKDGWHDITVAFPVNLREMERINRLAGQVQLNLLVEDQSVVQQLARNVKHKVGLFIKIDTGYHRTGLPVERTERIDSLLEEIGKHQSLCFKGFLTHAGNTYRATSKEQVLTIHRNNLQKLKELKQRYSEKYPELIISIGDTPSCSLAQNFAGIDEIRPGNFVFYDVMQWQIGACSLDEIAVALACPVVAKHRDRLTIVLYGGAVHLSKEALQGANGQPCFGLLVQLKEDGWQIPRRLHPLISLSQEHGIARVDETTFKKISIGDLVGVLPVHSCLTANLMRGYLGLKGQRIIE